MFLWTELIAPQQRRAACGRHVDTLAATGRDRETLTVGKQIRHSWLDCKTCLLHNMSSSSFRGRIRCLTQNLCEVTDCWASSESWADTVCLCVLKTGLSWSVFRQTQAKQRTVTQATELNVVRGLVLRILLSATTLKQLTASYSLWGPTQPMTARLCKFKQALRHTHSQVGVCVSVWFSSLFKYPCPPEGAVIYL